jgi:DNA gyrase inhibitor GyrI
MLTIMKNTFFLMILMTCFTMSLIAQEKTGTDSVKFKVTIKDVPEITMVYYEFTGPYEQAFNNFGQLMGYIQQNKIPMAAYSLGIYYDDPVTVSADKLRSEIGFGVTQKAETTGIYKCKTLAAGKAVAVKYTSMSDIMPAYEALGKYLTANNIKTLPYSVEIYYSADPQIVDAEILFYIAE